METEIGDCLDEVSRNLVGMIICLESVSTSKPMVVHTFRTLASFSRAIEQLEALVRNVESAASFRFAAEAVVAIHNASEYVVQKRRIPGSNSFRMQARITRQISLSCHELGVLWKYEAGADLSRVAG